MSSSAARVWITTGSPTRAGELELRLEGAPLVVARGVVAVVVEAGLADRARPRVGGRPLDLLEVAARRSPRVSCGWRPTIANTSSCSSAAASARAIDGSVHARRSRAA